MKELKNIGDLNEKVETTLSILDEEFQVPENLTDKILSHCTNIKPHRKVRKNLAVYLQIAAVLAAGVFLGVVLGKNADTNLFTSKENKKNRSLIEYKISHHLLVDRAYIFK